MNSSDAKVDIRGLRRRWWAAAAAVCAAGVTVLVVSLPDSAGAAARPASAASTAITLTSAPTPSAPGPSVPSTALTTALATPSTGSSTSASAQAALPTQLAAAQLEPTQLPGVAAEKWKPIGKPNSRAIAGHDITENECAQVHGASTWVQQGFSGGDGQNVAIQDTFAFSGAAAAQSAYTAFVTEMADCLQTTRALQQSNGVTPDAVVRQTGAIAQALAWERTWTGVLGLSAAGTQTNHIYAAVNGVQLIVLQFTEFPGSAAPYAVSGDPQVLAMLATETSR